MNVEASAAWENLCDTIKAAGSEILGSAQGLDAVNQAEGLRYLTRLLKGSFEKYIEFADPLDPHIFKMCDERSGYGGDNPDNIYSASPIREGETYEISGNRGDIWQFNFSVFKWDTNSQYELLGHLTDKDMAFDIEGNFTLVLGGKPRAGNWLPIPSGANQVMLRQTFRDRGNEREVSLGIRLLSRTSRPKPLQPAEVVERLYAARDFFQHTGLMMHGWSKKFAALENTLPLTDPQFIADGGGDPSAFFYISSWRLNPGEALLVHLPEFPAEQLWNLALFNFWFESMDYVNFRIHTNSRICDQNPDGSTTVVISSEDCGVGNWLDTTGHQSGNMIMRAWTDRKRPADPRTEVVQLESVDWRQKLQRWK